MGYNDRHSKWCLAHSNAVSCLLCISSLFDRTYAVRIQMGCLLPMTAYSAGGSMVLFCLFPPCRRRIGPFVQTTVWFGTDRVNPVFDTSYAVLHPADEIRLRQGGTDHPYFGKIVLGEHNFSKKERNVPCCRRRIGPLPCANAQFADPPRKSCQ
jgi:hypothetical protein